MKVRDVIRRLEEDGWRHVRTRGSHRQFQHSVKPGTVTVAGKPSIDVPPGTLPEFLELANDVAMHIAASQPANLEALLNQPFVKDSSVTVGEKISKVSAQLKEEVSVERFVRWDDEPPRPSDPPPHRPANVVRMSGRK